VTALIASLLATVAMVGVIFLYAGRRTPGAPLTWGEAYAGALFVFGLLVVAYAILPSQWLSYADNAVRWRSDKIGIPTGPLHYLPGWPTHGKLLFFIPVNNGLLWPHGLTFFGRGKVVISAQILRDVIVTVIYLLLLPAQVMGWLWWQRRGKRKVEQPQLTSAYGRPLIRKA
jgi:hypothetical protein